MADHSTCEANTGDGLTDQDGFWAEVKADHIRLHNRHGPGSVSSNQCSGAGFKDGTTIKFQVNRGARQATAADHKATAQITCGNGIIACNGINRWSRRVFNEEIMGDT